MLRRLKKHEGISGEQGRQPQTPRAQVIIEFTFCMVIIFLMIYGIIMLLRWTGVDLANRRVANDDLLIADINATYGLCVQWNSPTPPRSCVKYSTMASGPLKQIDPNFYMPTTMNTVWNGQ